MADDAQVRRAVTLDERMGGDAAAAAGSSTSGWAVHHFHFQFSSLPAL